MSLKAVVEIALHFESFRNIDLFHQGLYHVRARLHHEGNDPNRVVAVPCGHLASQPLGNPEPEKPKDAKQQRPDHHNLMPAHVVEEQNSFSTRSFLIRYCEEEVELNDIGLFRLELDVDDLEQKSSLLLEVDLMFADLTQHGGADRFGEQPDVDSTEFKSVSTQTFRVRKTHRGLHEFVPVVFDEYHFCVANLVVHSALVDFRLRLRQPSAASTAAPSSRTWSASEGKAAQQGSNAAREGGDCAGPSLSRRPSASGLAPAPAESNALSLADTLFGGCRAEESPELLLQRAEGLYRRHLEVLATSHTAMAAWHRRVRQECMPPPLVEALGDSSPTGDLGLELGDLTQERGAAAGGRGSLLRKRLEAKLGGDVSHRSIAAHLAYDLNTAASKIRETWHGLLNTLLYCSREVSTRLRADWEKQIAEQWSASIVREAARADVAVAEKVDLCEQHCDLADHLRVATSSRPAEDEATVEDTSLLPKMELRPLIFEQRYLPRNPAAPAQKPAEAPPEADDYVPSAPKPYNGVHLFVLVHGFQGNSFDMRLMRNNLALVHPDAIFLCSVSNEDSTEGDITEMGQRLAQEVVNYICDWCPGSALGRLSFVSHSMGGLISRAALPLLHEYTSKMFTFLTFSTSHLGIFQDKISLFNTGFWVLKQWRKSQFLKQVSMTDHQDPRETFLYKLSKSKGFEFFQNVVLVSCFEDQYGPFQSARAEICSQWDNQPDKGVYTEMVRQIWAPVNPEHVTRFDVNFVIPEKNLDTFIGRAAHIQFLECQPIMKMLIHNYSALFR